MNVEVVPLSPALGVEVRGLDLRHDQPPEVKAAVLDAFRRHWLVLVRGQSIDTAQHRRFVEWFGPVSTRGYAPSSEDLEKYISNTRADGVARFGALLTHQDFCFYEELLPGLSLYAEEVARDGGDTIFVNAALAYERLPDELRQRIDGVQARHVYDYANDYGTVRFRIASAPNAPTAAHPIALTHPVTGARILFVNELMTDSIDGLDEGRSEALLEQLWSYLRDPAVRYQHRWRAGDVIVWDNIALQHGRTDFATTERRSLRRFQIGPPAGAP